MKNRIVKLTESDLHKIVNESINRLLREDDYNYGQNDVPDNELTLKDVTIIGDCINKIREIHDRCYCDGLEDAISTIEEFVYLKEYELRGQLFNK